ncbi:MAG: hypothetical protein HYW23_00285 [Candidatus Aenigmarchaeota archaeon]|nr:hypothetical protein [Candidatus Aenigmarchaeota archaeon]
MRIIPKILTEKWWGNILLGFLAAVIFYYVILAGVLSSSTPVVAVVSSSMEHTNPEVTYYQWLGKNLGYNRSYIESWPDSNGFNVGDMPIVEGGKPFTGLFSLAGPSENQKYEVGDVIVYSVNGVSAPIIHRIIKINDDGTYQTKGDNNLGQLSYEQSVKPEQIKGKVIFIIPKIGYFKVILNRLSGV